MHTTQFTVISITKSIPASTAAASIQTPRVLDFTDLIASLTDNLSDDSLFVLGHKELGATYEGSVIGQKIDFSAIVQDPLTQKLIQSMAIVTATQPINLIKIGVQSGESFVNSALKHIQNGGFYVGAGISVVLGTVARLTQLIIYTEIKENLEKQGYTDNALATLLPVVFATVGETTVQHVAEKYLAGISKKSSPKEALASAFSKAGTHGISMTLSRNFIAAVGFFVLPETIQKVIDELMSPEIDGMDQGDDTPKSNKAGLLARVIAFSATFAVATAPDNLKQWMMNDAANKVAKLKKLSRLETALLAASKAKQYTPLDQQRFHKLAATIQHKQRTTKASPYRTFSQLLKEKGLQRVLFKSAGTRAVAGGIIAATLTGTELFLNKMASDKQA